MSRQARLDLLVRPLALGLIAAMLLLRLAIPAGWMPSSAGGLAFTICTGSGLQTVWLGSDGRLHKQAPDDPKPSADMPCAFAAAAALAMPSLLAPVVAGPEVAIVLPIDSGAVAIGRGLAAPPPPATGPPATR